MKKETAIKIVKWGVGLAIGVAATYGIFLYYDYNKSKGAVDTTGMVKYQITLPFKYQPMVKNIYEVLLPYKYAFVNEAVISDQNKVPLTITINIMALPEDAMQIKTTLENVASDIKFNETK